jgi:hypothetical protein
MCSRADVKVPAWLGIGCAAERFFGSLSTISFWVGSSAVRRVLIED